MQLPSFVDQEDQNDRCRNDHIGGEEFADAVGMDLTKKQAHIKPVLKQPRAELEIWNQHTSQS